MPTSNNRPLAAITPGSAGELSSELALRISRLLGTAEKQATAISRLTLHQRVAPNDSCPITYEPSVIVVAQGSKQVQIGKEILTYDSSRYLLVSVDVPTVTRVSAASREEPCLAASLKLDISIVREFLSRETFPVPDAPGEGHALSIAPVTPEFLHAWCGLLNLLAAPADIPFLSDLLEREIIYRILRGPEGGRLRAIATLGDKSNRTARAIGWIKTNYRKQLRVEELAEIAGMGVSTLHHSFRALTSMGPLQYQKHIRLQAARAQMLTADVDAATAAFAVGYESASQFNREYSRLFGQPPIRDIRNLRSQGAQKTEAVNAA